MSSQISSIQRSKIIAVFAGVVILGATAVLKLAQPARSTNTAVSSTLHAFVHNDASIGLTYDDGSAVGSQARVAPTIPPGTYTVKVVDDASEHNFHLTGPGVDLSTSIDGSESPTWTLTVQAGGSYKFQCDNHPDFMFGFFNGTGAATGGSSGGSTGGTSSGGTSSGGTSSGGTSSGGTSSGSGTTSNTTGGGSASATLATLTGSLNSSGKLTLTNNGKKVSSLKAGRYKFTVSDQDAKGGFTLQATAKSPVFLTATKFVGKHTVTVKLTAGKWSVFTTPGLKSKSSFTVTS